MRQVDLADAIEVEVSSLVHNLEQFGHFPAHAAERAPQSWSRLRLPLPISDELGAAYEPPLVPAVGERRAQLGALLLNAADRDTEMGWHILAGADECVGEVGPGKTDEAAVRRLTQWRQIHLPLVATVAVDHAHPRHLVTALAQPRHDSHTFRDLVTQAPEIDEIAAGPKCRCLLDEHRLVSPPPKPVSEGRPCDADSVNGNSHRRPPSWACATIDPMPAHDARVYHIGRARYSLRSNMRRRSGRGGTCRTRSSAAACRDAVQRAERRLGHSFGAGRSWRS
jgi:hypothetical protein